jgi:flagellar motility protein MotE (MotC chaperone)
VISARIARGALSWRLARLRASAAQACSAKVRIKDQPAMIRVNQIFLSLFLALAAVSASAPSWANEERAGGEEKKKDPPKTEPDMPGLRKVQLKKAGVVAPKLPVVEGVKGVEAFCGAVANSAASTRLSWQEERVRALQAQMVVKIAELDAKEAEVRDWVQKREQLLARANESLTAIYSKMKPDAASAQISAMDDDSAAAILLKLKPSVASAVMGEMNAERAARLSDLLSGAAAKSDEKKS